MSDDTQPNWKAHLQALIAVTDPIIDKILLKVVASGFSPAWVLGFVLALLAIGIWIGHKP